MRNIARFFLPIFLIWSVLWPRVSEATVIPFPAGAVGVEAMTGAAVDVAVINPAVALAIIGFAAYFMLRDSGTGNAIRIPGGTAAANVVPVPAAPATATPVLGYILGVSAGSQAQANACQGGVMSITTNDPSVACAAYACDAAVNGYTGATPLWTVLTSTTGNCKTMYNGSAINNMNWSMSVQCPLGYTASGSACNLSNPYLATAPTGNVDVTRSGNAYAIPTGQTPGSIQPTLSTTTTANDTLSVSSKDASGNRVLTTVQATSAGTTINVATQKPDANGNTYVQNQTYNFDLSGNPVNATQTAAAQQLSYNPATNTYTPAAAPASTTAPATQPIQFPSDYARTGEAAAAAASVNATLNQTNTKLDTLHNDLTSTANAPADPILPLQSDFQNSFFNGTFSNLLSWAPNTSGSCPTYDFNFNYFGQVFAFTLNSHCQLLENNRATMSTIMVAGWTILALFIVLGA